MHSKHQHLTEKIFDTDHHASLQRMIRYWRFKDYEITFTNGCFDLFHPGHVDFLARAADLAQVLIVGLNTDASVQRLKGLERPLHNQQGRAQILASLAFVDAVVLFDEDTPEIIIDMIRPDVLVKGSDYQPEDIAGAGIVEQNKGIVCTLPLLEGYSTSGIIQKIKNIH